jgi:putative ABC transport system permease protein
VALQNAFVLGSTIHTALAAMASTRDAVLLADESIRDYQSHVRDKVRLRLPVGPADYLPVTFHVVGKFSEFATAPEDSFIVANADSVGQVDGPLCPVPLSRGLV